MQSIPKVTGFILTGIALAVALTASVNANRPGPAAPPVTFVPVLTKTVVMPVSARQLWAHLSSPGHLKQSHPFTREISVVSWIGKGSIDRLVYYNGDAYERRFVNWIDQVGYDLTVSTAGQPDQPIEEVSWRIKPLSAHKSQLTISVNYGFPAEMPAAKREAIIASELNPLLDRYFTALTQGISYFVTTGQPVKRNQFGSLEPISPTVQ